MEEVSIFRDDDLGVADISLVNTPNELPENLEPLYIESVRGIDEDEIVQLRDLLLKYQGCFSKNSEDMGLTNMAEHKIDTGNSRPIKQVPRRIPLAKIQDVNKEIREMLAKGRIR